MKNHPVNIKQLTKIVPLLPIPSKMKVAYYTLGCKLNFSETSQLATMLSKEGFEEVAFEATPDLYIINTCSVTANADKECKSIVNRALNINPEALIAITGCYAQLKPETISQIPGVSIVLGAKDKFNINAYKNLLKGSKQSLIMACEISEVDNFIPSHSGSHRTRVFLKVQDGCDYSCSFCTIPMARGKSRSNTKENILHQINKLADEGAKEVVLTGINLGDAGRLRPNEKHAYSFHDLMEHLEINSSIPRIRISSIEPNLLQDETIQLVSRSKKIMPHFHIPLQSGSDYILKKMRRRYLRDVYESRIQLIKQLMPHACIGSDVITGFPDETENDFDQTYQFINQLPVSYLHVFTYSERDHTLAALMEQRVPLQERKKRTHLLRTLSLRKQKTYEKSAHKGVHEVLFEAELKNDFMVGYSANYIKVRHEYNPALVNQIVTSTLKQSDENGIFIAQIMDEAVRSFY